jgi:hypothetical protein
MSSLKTTAPKAMASGARVKVLKEEADNLRKEISTLQHEITTLKATNHGLRTRITKQQALINRKSKALAYYADQSELMEDEIRLFLPTDFGGPVPGLREDMTIAITEGAFETKEGWETEMKKRVLGQAGTLAANLSVAGVMAVHVQPGKWVAPGKLEVHLRVWMPKEGEDGEGGGGVENEQGGQMDEEIESSSPCPRAEVALKRALEG